MVSRSGFFIRDNKIVQRIVQINWNEGFDKQAKHIYIKRIVSALGSDVGKVADVTSASPVSETRVLSPLFIRESSSGLSLEDIWEKIESPLPYLFHYLYLCSLSEENKETILSYDCYSDVFHNPEKELWNTQAFSVTLYRLLHDTNKEEVLKDYNSFSNWLKDQTYILERR